MGRNKASDQGRRDLHPGPATAAGIHGGRQGEDEIAKRETATMMSAVNCGDSALQRKRLRQGMTPELSAGRHRQGVAVAQTTKTMSMSLRRSRHGGDEGNISKEMVRNRRRARGGAASEISARQGDFERVRARQGGPTAKVTRARRSTTAVRRRRKSLRRSSVKTEDEGPRAAIEGDRGRFKVQRQQKTTAKVTTKRRRR